MVKTLCFHGRGCGLDPWLGNLNPTCHVALPKIKKKKNGKKILRLGQSRNVVQLLTHVRLPNRMNCSSPGFPILHYLLEFAQTHVLCVDDSIQPSHPLSPTSPSCPQSFPASGSFSISRLFTSGGQSIGASASILPMSIQS